MKKSAPEKAECCPVYRIIDKVSKKWCLHILRLLSENKRMRFCEIQEALPQINTRMLSERLSELEEADLIAREVKEVKPICVQYTITDKGADLRKIFSCFHEWGKKWGEGLEHENCCR